MSLTPEISIYERQEGQAVNIPWLEQAARLAMPYCLKAAKTPEAFDLLPEIEVSIVTDDEIARVHSEFMSDPSPTDVITFHHGEILISADTAAREGPPHGHTTDQELLLYIIHGLLHLGGWDDHDPEEQREMHAAQDQILKELMS